MKKYQTHRFEQTFFCSPDRQQNHKSLCKHLIQSSFPREIQRSNSRCQFWTETTYPPTMLWTNQMQVYAPGAICYTPVTAIPDEPTARQATQRERKRFKGWEIQVIAGRLPKLPSTFVWHCCANLFFLTHVACMWKKDCQAVISSCFSSPSSSSSLSCNYNRGPLTFAGIFNLRLPGRQAGSNKQSQVTKPL